ncbi:hypothetical protein JKF63_05128 [Porcisia hertigi]|uniref:Gamma-butyrobetaine hydroxylase-like N-terminal domain-containing protein n=1 Tax=Porcisia hertigi TaxID=2761500 RepID=A0A836LCW9_9TRYP|nr:hypothetical protein JKF63_05128 [Porcisia hertigi]
MNRVMHRGHAVARLSSLSVGRASASASPPLLSSLLHTAHGPYTPRRLFSSALLSKLGDSVASSVSQLAENVWLSDERLVTEPRRLFKAQRVANTSLAERLMTQRNVRQRLVPTSIKVDKSRQYVEFTWPEEAVDAMRTVSQEGEAPDTERPPSVSSGCSSTAAAAPSSSVSSSVDPTALPQIAKPATGSADCAIAGESTCTPLSSSCQPRLSPGVPLRTRALAEYLRAYTPSTDGALCGKDIIIYGRRGISITKIIPVGNYALRFVFSDDHSGGIYSYEYLYYLTGPTTKYSLMRGYITELRQRRKSRNAPKRSPSTKYAKTVLRSATRAPEH